MDSSTGKSPRGAVDRKLIEALRTPLSEMKAADLEDIRRIGKQRGPKMAEKKSTGFGWREELSVRRAIASSNGWSFRSVQNAF